MEKDHEHAHKIGKTCKGCGHPSGAHHQFIEADLDEPDSERAGCNMEDCACAEFRE